MKAKVFLALPFKHYIEPDTMKCIEDFIYGETAVYRLHHRCFLRGSPNIYIVRNTTAVEFLKTDCDYYLYFDSDQVIFEPKNAIDLLVTADRDIISPIIVRRFFPYTPACMSLARRASLDKGRDIIDDFRKYPHDRPYEVHFSCGGIALIKRAVIEAVKDPFLPVYDKDGAIFGTDLGFYYKAKQQGFKCWVDPRINVGHITQVAVSPDDYYACLDKKLIYEKDGKVLTR